MSGSTSIEWATAVWNPTVGCSRVSAGCERCYAERVAHRGLTEAHRDLTRSTSRGPVWTGEVRLVQKAMDWPLRRRKPERIFVNSMSDVFHESLEDRTIASLFSIMASAHALHGHQHLVLTKRAARMAALVPRFRWLHGLQLVEFANGQKHFLQHRCVLAEDLDADLASGALKVVGEAPADRQFGPWIGSPPGVWLGVSCENQEAADERVPLLLQTPAAVRFVSAEPLLSSLDLGRWLRATTRHHMRLDVLGALRNKSFDGYRDDDGRPMNRAQVKAKLLELHDRGVEFIPVGSCDNFEPEHGCRGHAEPRLDWVIVGGESGPGARPCLDAWIRGTAEQCRAAKVPAFIKQLGAQPLTYGALECFVDGGWPMGARLHVGTTMQDPYRVQLRDRKGGDTSEWPPDLRIRELPAMTSRAESAQGGT